MTTAPSILDIDTWCRETGFLSGPAVLASSRAGNEIRAAIAAVSVNGRPAYFALTSEMDPTTNKAVALMLSGIRDAVGPDNFTVRAYHLKTPLEFDVSDAAAADSAQRQINDLSNWQGIGKV